MMGSTTMLYSWTVACHQRGSGARRTIAWPDTLNFGYSDTRIHWKESVQVKAGDTVGLVDVTSAGEHECRIATVVEGSGLEWEAAWDDETKQCGVCQREGTE